VPDELPVLFVCGLQRGLRAGVGIERRRSGGPARQAEAEGANAVYLMITADYPLSRYLEVATEIRRSLRPETPLVANVGDFTLPQAQRLKQVGFVGIYHAVRLGEGRDTSIPVERRLQTMLHAREAGLLVGTCLEPIGPEHGSKNWSRRQSSRAMRGPYTAAPRGVFRFLVPRWAS